MLSQWWAKKKEGTAMETTVKTRMGTFPIKENPYLVLGKRDKNRPPVAPALGKLVHNDEGRVSLISKERLDTAFDGILAD